MSSDFSMRSMNVVHRAVLALTGGRLGWNLGGMTVIELTTVGRKSGQLRRAMLTVPLREGSAYILVASRGGDDVHPAWYLNLRDNPHVEVALRGKKGVRMLARTATADERARMWPEITRRYSNYAGYQRRTSREIPLVILTPEN